MTLTPQHKTYTLRRMALAAAVAVAVAATPTAQSATPQVAVLSGYAPTIAFYPIDGSSYPLGSTSPLYGSARTIALRYDAQGQVADVFMPEPDFGRIFRYAVASNTWSVAATYTGKPRGLAVDGAGNIYVAMRTPTDGGCIFRLSADFSTSDTVWCDPANHTPWAVVIRPDGQLLVAWNDDFVQPGANHANGVVLLNPATGLWSDLTIKVQAYSAPFLTSVAIAPGGTVYVAEHQAGGLFSGVVSAVNASADPSSNRTPITLTYPPFSHQLVRPEQIAIGGTATAPVILVADSSFNCGGGPGGGGGGGGGGCGMGTVVNLATGPFNIGFGFGPFGVAIVGAGVTMMPVDALTGTTPVSLTFDRISGAGATTLEISSTGPPPPAGFALGAPATYFNVATSVDFTGGAMTICVNYSNLAFADESQLVLQHFDGTAWVALPDQTLDAATNVACGRTTSLSPFALMEREVVHAMPGAMSGDGMIRDALRQYVFHFDVVERASGLERAQFSLVTEARTPRRGERPDRFVSETTTAVAFSDDPNIRPALARADSVVFSGVGRWNGIPGYRYAVEATELAGPGRRRETVRITIVDAAGATVASVSGELFAGAIRSVRIQR
jgi:hypothetical protein